MRRALSLLRHPPVYRRERFAEGLQAAGYQLCQALPDPRPGDLLVIWNRYSIYDTEARRFEQACASVLVAENGYLAGTIPGKWHALAVGHHGGAGRYRYGGPQRWDALGVDLAPWRADGREVLILGQRSIGEPGIASPPGWAEATQKRIGGRIRPHPGKHGIGPPLVDDLRDVRCVVTWASSAALIALMHGVPVWYEMPRWIGAGACRSLAEWGAEPKRDDAARLEMFRRLIWAQATVEEIQSGEAFRRLLQ